MTNARRLRSCASLPKVSLAGEITPLASPSSSSRGVPLFRHPASSTLTITYSARLTPVFRDSPAVRSTQNPRVNAAAATSASVNAAAPDDDASFSVFLLVSPAAPSKGLRNHAAILPPRLSRAFARSSSASNIARGVHTAFGPSPTPIAAERTPYGKSVTIASHSSRLSRPTRGPRHGVSSRLARPSAHRAPGSSFPSIPSRRIAPAAAANASSSTSAPTTRLAPSLSAASSAAPPPTHGSHTTSPGRTLAALHARNACRGGMALGASTAWRAARVSSPHAMTSHIVASGWRYTCGTTRGGVGSSARRSSAGFSSDAATAMSHARSAATALPTPASHSSAPTRSRTTLGTPLRPGASTCAAHFAARSGPMAEATAEGSPLATGASAMRVRAHRRTAARAAARAASASSLSLCASAAANPSSSPAADSMISSTVLGFGGGADCSARFFLRFPSGLYSRSESESSIDASSSSMKSPSGVSSGAKPALAALDA
mmetsp:Transcript_14322/g.60575  ORF Transcript_14322/g.60575 Transcript_14322/m.60575 type:complete len:490 (+) Transcript_14322:2066-3535(+)